MLDNTPSTPIASVYIARPALALSPSCPRLLVLYSMSSDSTVSTFQREKASAKGKVSAVKKFSTAMSLTKKPQKHSRLSDVLGRSADIMEMASTIGAAAPVPWISAAINAGIKVLQVFQVSFTVNAS